MYRTILFPTFYFVFLGMLTSLGLTTLPEVAEKKNCPEFKDVLAPTSRAIKDWGSNASSSSGWLPVKAMPSVVPITEARPYIEKLLNQQLSSIIGLPKDIWIEQAPDSLLYKFAHVLRDNFPRELTYQDHGTIHAGVQKKYHWVIKRIKEIKYIHGKNQPILLTIKDTNNILETYANKYLVGEEKWRVVELSKKLNTNILNLAKQGYLANPKHSKSRKHFKNKAAILIGKKDEIDNSNKYRGMLSDCLAAPFVVDWIKQKLNNWQLKDWLIIPLTDKGEVMLALFSQMLDNKTPPNLNFIPSKQFISLKTVSDCYKKPSKKKTIGVQQLDLFGPAPGNTSSGINPTLFAA